MATQVRCRWAEEEMKRLNKPPPFGRSSNIKPAHKRRNKLNATNRPRGQLIDRHSGVACARLKTPRLILFRFLRNQQDIHTCLLSHISMKQTFSCLNTRSLPLVIQFCTPLSMAPKKRHNISLASFAVPAIWWVMCFHMPKNISNTKN